MSAGGGTRMTDERKTIGSAGKAGRGNRQTSPSAAARALAGAPPAKKPVAKAKTEPAEPRPSQPKKARRQEGAAKKAAPTKPSGRQGCCAQGDASRRSHGCVP